MTEHLEQPESLCVSITWVPSKRIQINSVIKSGTVKGPLSHAGKPIRTTPRRIRRFVKKRLLGTEQLFHFPETLTPFFLFLFNQKPCFSPARLMLLNLCAASNAASLLSNHTKHRTLSSNDVLHHKTIPGCLIFNKKMKEKGNQTHAQTRLYMGIHAQISFTLACRVEI